MLSWIATRLHQDTGRSGISWLGKGELTALKRPASGHCLFPEFSKIQKEQWPTMRGFQPSPSRLQSCLLNVLLCHSATFQSALKSRCLCPSTGYSRLLFISNLNSQCAYGSCSGTIRMGCRQSYHSRARLTSLHCAVSLHKPFCSGHNLTLLSLLLYLQRTLRSRWQSQSLAEIGWELANQPIPEGTLRLGMGCKLPVYVIACGMVLAQTTCPFTVMIKII